MTEAELLARFKQGDAEAFGSIYERYKGGLYGYALSLAQDATRAQDFVQDVWLRFIERAAQLAEDTRLGPYLYTAVKHRAIDESRRRKSEQNALAGQARQATELVLPRDGPGGAEEAARLNAALLELPEEQRETVLLRIYSDFTFEQLAEITGAPAKTVMSRYRLALEKLNRALGAGSEAAAHS